MSKILVFCEHSQGQIKRSSRELLTFAKKTGFEFHAVALGGGSKKLESIVGGYGAKRLLYSEDGLYENYNSELYTSALTDVIKKISPQFILAPSSAMGRDLFPRLSARLGLACVSDCTVLTQQGSELVAQKPLYSGKCLAEIQFAPGAGRVILMRANQLPVEELLGAAPSEKIETQPVDLKSIVKSVVKGASQKLDLTEANVIVSGGRGMKGPEHFKLLEDLADVLGATVGASRAVCDAGWLPHNMQVGQTGKTVAPSLYIAVGISGAIQHLAGMSGSKVIVAINSDPEAPIFKKASYGIVGDAFKVVPLLTEEFRKVLRG